MNLLKFLLISDVNIFIKNFIHYLVDAGHEVTVFCPNYHDTQTFLDIYKSKITTISSSELHRLVADYQICFVEGANPVENISTILFNVTPDQSNIGSLLSIQGKQTANLFEIPIDFTIEGITDLFIDTVIALSRNGHTDLTLQEKSSPCDFLQKIIIQEKLNSQKELIFKIESLTTALHQSTALCKKNIVIQDCLLSKVDCELLLLYVLTLLNGRNESIYSYQLATQDSQCYKFINILLGNRYHDFITLCSNDLYTFFKAHVVENYDPSIVLCYDCDDYHYTSLASKAILLLSYNSSTQSLTIRHHQSLTFFEEIDYHIHQFMQNFACFRAGEISFEELLALSPEYLQKNKYHNIPTTTQSDGPLFMHQRFEQQAKINPNRIAVVFGNIKLSYHALNHKANQLAHYLMQHHTLGTEAKIVLCLDQDEQALVSILAVLKAGACYVPVSPKLPTKRIEFIIGDCQPALIITTKKELFQPYATTPVIDLANDFTKTNINKQISDNPDKKIKEDALAYLIYTSGTTGIPKGVMIEHRSVLNMIQAQSMHFELSETDTKNCLWYADYVFDAHVSEVFTCLLNSHTLYILDQPSRFHLPSIAYFIKNHQIDIATIPPILLDNKTLLELKILVVAGDRTNKNILDFYQSHCIKVLNAYGPTEGTVCTTICSYQDNPTDIGFPIQNTLCYVLDKNQTPLPMGVIGELYIGGVGLARGYIDPDLTQEKFIYLNLPQQPALRLYRTGDLVKYTNSGSLEFIGRSDRQVKLRGYRIELGEIDYALMQYPSISQCITIISANQSLISYYLSLQELVESDLESHLQSLLPEYMIPKIFIRLSKLPLTLNGKIDLQQLPDPTSVSVHTLPPRTELERAICDVWSEVFEKAEIVDIERDFFALGGDSIKSIQLANRLREKLRLDINIKDIFTYRTIKNISENFSPLISELIPQNWSQNNRYPANSLQQGFIYHSLKQGEIDDAYHIQLLWEYQKKMDIEVLKQAWQYAQQKFSALRLRFEWKDTPIQIIEPVGTLHWTNINLCQETDERTRRAKINNIVQSDREKIFQLDAGNLFRVYFIQQSNEMALCLFSNHHSIIDGWSTKTLIDYVHNTYIALLNNKPVDSSECHTYEIVQEYLLTHKSEHQEYWSLIIKSIDSRCNLNTLLYNTSDNTQINVLNYQHVKKLTEAKRQIKDSLFDGIKHISMTYGVTANAILQYVWHKVLSLYGDSHQTITGTTVAGRGLPINHIETAVGLFINTLPLVINHRDHHAKTCIQIIQNVQAQITELNLYNNIDLATLQKDNSRLFDSLFVYENFPITINEYKNQYIDMRFKQVNEKTDYPLGMVIFEQNDLIEIKMQYAGEIFDSAKMSALLDLMIHLLKQITDNSHQLEHMLSYTSPTKQQALLRQPFTNKTFISTNSRIIQVFEHQVENYPDNIAVKFKCQQLTYDAINKRVNQFSRYLLAQGITQSDYVLLSLDRSIDAIVTILAVLKIGAVYIPLEPKDPIERAKSIMKDSGSNILLTQEKYQSHYEGFSGKIISVDTVQSCIEKLALTNLNTYFSSDNLAYIIYTSGSTGSPKGVMINHASLENYLNFAVEQYIGDGIKSVPLHSSLAFDMSVTSLFAPLITGNYISIISDDGHSTNFNELASHFNQSHFIKLTPSLLTILEQCLDDSQLKDCQTKFIIGGEQLSTKTVQFWQKKAPHIELYNEYGPTEATVACSLYKIPSYLSLLSSNIPIGQPLWNTRIFILDDRLRPVPKGVCGELYIAGKGLAVGYLNQEDLTSKKFIQAPFPLDCSEKLYKTGDKGLINADGELECLGRFDNQVKLRGYRIECGEIEAKLQSHGDIKNAVILYHTDLSELVAYIISNEFTPTTLELNIYLGKHLPEYMIPKHFVILDEYPLTTNGKLNTKELKTMVPNTQSILSGGKENNSSEEIKMIKIWKEALNVPQLSVNDNFFEKGGHSLLATKLISKLKEAYQTKITLRCLFDNPTVSELIEKINAQN